MGRERIRDNFNYFIEMAINATFTRMVRSSFREGAFARQFRLHPPDARGYRAVMKASAMLAVAGAFSTLTGCGSTDNSLDNAVNPPTTILVSDAIAVTGDTGIYTYGDDGSKTEIRFPIATDRVDPVLYHNVQRIGESDGVVAVLDSYGSRKGGERCANGRESWVRLFSTVQQRLTDSILAESCLDRRDTGEPPVTWQGDGFTIAGKAPRKFKIVNGKARSDKERRAGA